MPPAMPKLAKMQGSKKNKPPIKQPYFTMEQVAEVLIASRGRRSEAGKMLGCCARTITDYIKRHPKLQELDEEIRTARLDMCGDVVDMHVERCDLRAAMFQLRLLGKHRGYSDLTEINTQVGQLLQFVLSPASCRNRYG